MMVSVGMDARLEGNRLQGWIVLLLPRLRVKTANPAERTMASNTVARMAVPLDSAMFTSRDVL